MNRTIITMLGITLTLVGLVVASSQTRRPPEVAQTGASTAQLQQARLEKVMTTQQGVNRYFHSEVMPRLKDCWNSLRGSGSVELDHEYKKGADGRWRPSGLVVSKSTLPKGQETIAVRCMQVAAGGTSFPAEGTDGTTTTYVIKWKWPVPFPPNAGQLTTAMFARLNNGGGGGGCDGQGTAAKCYTCSKDGHDCEKVCVGYSECKVTFPGRLCTAQGKCASGGPFGLAGGGIIY